MSREEQIYIIFNGPPGSGKDEACAFLSSQYGFKHLEFKQALFRETYKHFGVSEEWFMESYNDRAIKGFKKEPLLENRTRREALIYVSEEVIKPKHGKDFFGLKAYELVDGISSYCFSDGGFIEEVEVLINKIDSISIVQLYRSGCDFTSDSRKYIDGNIQDTFVLGSVSTDVAHIKHDKRLPIRTYQIHNNGTLGDFHSTIKTIIRRERDVVRQEKSRLLSRKSL